MVTLKDLPWVKGNRLDYVCMHDPNGVKFTLFRNYDYDTDKPNGTYDLYNQSHGMIAERYNLDPIETLCLIHHHNLTPRDNDESTPQKAAS
jgi:hypothetical protein